MKPAYKHFRELKQLQKDVNIQKHADMTLDCYDKIQEMFNEGHDDGFLHTVYDFIIKHEYVTAKQYEIVDRIYRHRFDEEAGDLPF